MPFPQNRNNEGQGGLIPAPQLPVRKFDTPAIGDAYYVERVDVTSRDYVSLVRGTRYSTLKNANQKIIDQFPTLFFMRETLDPFFWPWALRYWSTDEKAESTYDSTVTYINENVDYPMYARQVCIPRENYEANPTTAIGSPFTGITGVRVDAAGTGYTKDDEVVFSSGSATAVLVVGDSGEILLVSITAEGSGYDSDSPPTITINTEAGTGATLTALMQDKTTVLTSQKKVEFPDDAPEAHEKIKLLLIYETLPGPFDYSTRLDWDGMVVSIATRRNIAADIESGEDLVPNNGGSNWIVTTKKGDQNSFVADEVVETRGVPGNNISDTRKDFDGAVVTVTKTLGEADLITSDEDVYAGIWIWRTKESLKGSSKVAIQVQEARAVPGNSVFDTRLDPDGVVVAMTRTLGESGDIESSSDVVGGISIKKSREKFATSSLVAIQLIEFRGVPGNLIPSVLIGSDLYGAYTSRILAYTDDIQPAVQVQGDLIATVEKKEVSNLLSEQITTVKKWLDDADYSVTIPNVVPVWARALVPTVTVSHKVAGYASQPALGLGEFTRAEKQLDAEFKRVTVESLNLGGIRLTLQKKGLTEKFGGATTTITVQIDLEGAMSIDEGLLVLDSTIDQLGNGLEVKVSEVADGVEWTRLYGQDYDETLDVEIPFTEKTIDPGESSLGGAHRDVKPEDKWRSKERQLDIEAAREVLGSYVMQYPSKVNINMPNKLVSLTSQIESQTGDGAHSEIGTSTGYGSYNIALDMTADATANASILPEVVPIVKQFYGENIDCMHYIFFLENPVVSSDVFTRLNEIIGSTPSAWPKFNPETVNLLIVGADAALQVKASSKGSYSQVFDLSSQSSTAGGGTGYSRGRGLKLRRMEIADVIHGALTVEGVTTDTVDLAAYCTAEAGGLGPYEHIEQTDEISAFTSPTSFDPSCGDTDWPTSGKFLFRDDARPYKYGFVMFHALVVDAADFPSAEC